MSAHTQSSSEQQADPLLGQVVQGHYRILQRVAKGGMAWIYRAEHTTLRNDLAIKILFPQLLEEPELCERFLEEARIQFTLKHPNIVQVTDVISERGLVGIVLEWINGRDLRYWLKQHRQPFTPFQIREVMMPVVDAVGYAHEKGIVHRDLKPGNIIFHHEGKRITAKVADFGIAKMLDEVDSQTKTGTMMGTLQYMSPEQIRDSKYVDQRSDIYSLGVILFRMATARLPFREKNALALMRQHEMVKPPRPSDLVPPIPAELDAIILRCLEKRPEDRFQTGEELYHALQELPEASVHSKYSLFPSYLIGQPAQDDFGDPSQSNPHGVKVIGSGGPLPTASIAPTDDSYIGGPRGYQTPTPRPRPYPGTGTPLPHTRPPQTRPPHSGPSALADDLALDLEPIPTGQPTGTPHAKTRTAAQRALDRVDSVVPQPTPQEDKKPSSNMLPLVVLFLFLLGGGGAAVYFVGPFGKTPPKPIVDAGAVAKKPPKKRKDNILDKLDKAVDDALRALKMEKLVLASTKLKQAMRFRSKGSKRPAWHQTKYYPGLYRIAGRVARGQNKPYAALRYLTNYVNANMTGKSKIEIEKHKQKSALIQKKDLPKLRKTVKRVASQAELQLAKLEKDIKRNRLTSAYATYTLLRKSTTDNPEVYRKLARSLQAFFPILTVAI
jgi:serine/threonine protein kinase